MTERRTRHGALPPTLAPRGLGDAEAAAYIGIGVTLFRAMVADGRMPKPKLINSRQVWDRRAIDRAFDALPDVDGNADGVNSADALLG
jgi:hypothetical protein